jgi:hypothetical protein
MLITVQLKKVFFAINSIVTFLLSISVSAQSTPKSFVPESFIGKWKGTYFMVDSDGNKDSLNYEFHFLPSPRPNQWVQHGFYTSAVMDSMEKRYMLRIDPDQFNTSHFKLDEMNGIVIDEMLIGNTFYSQYTVLDQYFTTILRLEGGELYFELICNAKNIVTESCVEEDGIAYYTTSFPPFAVQYVRMKKIEQG